MSKTAKVKIYSVGVWNFYHLVTKILPAALKFTPLEFETFQQAKFWLVSKVKIYSVGVWNNLRASSRQACRMLKFTPLEFETAVTVQLCEKSRSLKFTPLEFETLKFGRTDWKFSTLKFTPLEFETYVLCDICRARQSVKIYSVGVWNSDTKSRAALRVC